MTDTTAPVLSKTDLDYLQIALTRLADDYDSQHQDAPAVAVRLLAERLKSQSPARGLSPQRQAEFQQRFMEAAARGPDAVQPLLEEWYRELLQNDPRASHVLAPILVQQMLNAGKQTAVTVLVKTGKKLDALGKRMTSAEALEALGEWLAQGLDAAQGGKALWRGDPDVSRDS